jgi:hypothetical protein
MTVLLLTAAPKQNPPRISADGFSSATIHFEQNTMLHWTSQTVRDFLFHSTGKILSHLNVKRSRGAG